MPDPINNQDDNKGTDLKKTENIADPNEGKPKDGEKAFDEKVFEDPRLWQHPRFKSLNERAKKADDLENEKKQIEEKRLEDGKKFEELAAKRAAERDTYQSKYNSSLQDNRIIIEASKIGVVDVDAVLKLIDRSNIRIDESGNVIGALEAVTNLVNGKPYLKGSGKGPIGTATNPSPDSDPTAKRFKLSQLNNADFYKANEADILKAYKLGLIEDDMH